MGHAAGVGDGHGAVWPTGGVQERHSGAVAQTSSASYQLALTSLRNIIGQHDLDEVLQERDKINALLRAGMEGQRRPGAWSSSASR